MAMEVAILEFENIFVNKWKINENNEWKTDENIKIKVPSLSIIQYLFLPMVKVIYSSVFFFFRFVHFLPLDRFFYLRMAKGKKRSRA